MTGQSNPHQTQLSQPQLVAGRYRLIDRWSEGKHNFCETYLAEDTHLPNNPPCVVKRLLFKDPGLSFMQKLKRLFHSEAKALDKLGTHRQIPELKAHFEEDQSFYLVQELIDGDNLEEREITPGNRWLEDQVIDFLCEVLDILVFVHQHNVIHRDIKPSNLMRRHADGNIFLIDFGAVKEIASITSNPSGQMTSTITIGTHGYMPAEQAIGQPRFCSDIYALGITAIQALTGVHPINLPKDEYEEVLWRELASVSPQLASILDKMVRYNFIERYQSAQDVLNDLRKLKPPGSRPRTVGGAAFGKLALTFFLGALVGAVLSVGVLRFFSAFDALNLYNKGNKLSDKEEYEEAIAAFDAALQAKPDFSAAWVDRGYALGQLKRHAERFASCDTALLFDRHLVEAWNCRGIARDDLQQYELALQDYDRAIELNPDFAAAWYGKADTLLKMKRHRDALDALDQARRIDPKYLFAWNLKCRAHDELNELDDAINACERALEIKPNYGPAQQRLKSLRLKLRQ